MMISVGKRRRERERERGRDSVNDIGDGSKGDTFTSKNDKNGNYRTE